MDDFMLALHNFLRATHFQLKLKHVQTRLKWPTISSIALIDRQIDSAVTFVNNKRKLNVLLLRQIKTYQDIA